VKTFEDQEAIK